MIPIFLMFLFFSLASIPYKADTIDSEDKAGEVDFEKIFASLLKELEQEETKSAPQPTPTKQIEPSLQKTMPPEPLKNKLTPTLVDTKIVSDIIGLIKPLHELHKKISISLFEDDDDEDDADYFLPSEQEALYPFLQKTEQIIQILYHFCPSTENEQLYLSVLNLPKYEKLQNEIAQAKKVATKLLRRTNTPSKKNSHSKLIKDMTDFSENRLESLIVKLQNVISSPEAREKVASKQKEIADTYLKANAERKNRDKQRLSSPSYSNSSSTPYYQKNHNRYQPYQPYGDNNFPYEGNNYQTEDENQISEPQNLLTDKTKDNPSEQKLTNNQNKNGSLWMPKNEPGPSSKPALNDSSFINSIDENEITQILKNLVKQQSCTLELLEEFTKLYVNRAFSSWLSKVTTIVPTLLKQEDDEENTEEISGDTSEKKAEELFKADKKKQEKQRIQEFKKVLLEIQPILVKLALHPISADLVEIQGIMPQLFPPILIAFQEKYHPDSAIVQRLQQQIEAVANNLTDLGASSFSVTTQRYEKEVARFEEKRNKEFVETLTMLAQLKIQRGDVIAYCNAISQLSTLLLEIPKTPTFKSASLKNQRPLSLQQAINTCTEALVTQFEKLKGPAAQLQKQQTHPYFTPIKSAIFALQEVSHRWSIPMPFEQPTETQAARNQPAQQEEPRQQVQRSQINQASNPRYAQTEEEDDLPSLPSEENKGIWSKIASFLGNLFGS